MPAMPEIQTPPTAQRSALMRSIKPKSKSEILLAACLADLDDPGLFRVNDRSLPGSPDFAFHRHRFAVFVDGAWWHGRGSRPKTNAAWWAEKFRRNRARDRRNDRDLRRMGWEPYRIDAGFVMRRPEVAAMLVLHAIRKRGTV